MTSAQLRHQVAGSLSDCATNGGDDGPANSLTTNGSMVLEWKGEPLEPMIFLRVQGVITTIIHRKPPGIWADFFSARIFRSDAKLKIRAQPF
jgi:hypothetical protein